MGILQLLAKENYIAYSKPLAKVVGTDEAIVFGSLCSISNIHGDEFFCQQERLCEDTCLSEYRLRNAIKNLQEVGLVNIVKKGLPAKNYYWLNEKRFLEILDLQRTSSIKFDTTGDSKTDTTGDSRTDSTYKKIKNKNINIKNKDNIYITVIDYLNQKAGTSYRAKSKTTQQHINARLSEGYTIEDFKIVIDKQCAKWKGTEWEQYLRPQTLFGTKFENYLNAKVTRQSKSKNDGYYVNNEEDSLDDLF